MARLVVDRMATGMTMGLTETEYGVEAASVLRESRARVFDFR